MAPGTYRIPNNENTPGGYPKIVPLRGDISSPDSTASIVGNMLAGMIGPQPGYGLTMSPADHHAAGFASGYCSGYAAGLSAGSSAYGGDGGGYGGSYGGGPSFASDFGGGDFTGGTNRNDQGYGYGGYA